MKNNNNKTKYAAQVAVAVLVFAFLTVPAQASEITPANVIKYVNLAREAQGLPDLVVNPKLMQVAKDKLDDMIAGDYFAHTSPTGVNPWHWFEKENYDYHYAGENLAINFTNAEDEQSAWMKSPTHRKNILDKNYEEIGVAVGAQKLDGQTSIIAVQEFGATFSGIPTGEKNFSPVKNSNLKTDNGKIVPQVLSAKDATPQEISGEPVGGNGTSWFENNKVQLAENGLLGSIVILILCITLAASAFLSVALEKMRSIVGNMKAEKEASA